MFLCIEKSHWTDKVPLVETSPGQRSSPRTECLFNHPTSSHNCQQNRHWKSICCRLQLKTQDCHKRKLFFLLKWTHTTYKMCSFFFYGRFFQISLVDINTTAPRSYRPFAGFPILAKLFSIEGTGRTLAIAIGVVLILGFEWRAPGQTKTWDIGMWALHGACWYRYHGAIDKLDHAPLVWMFESFSDFVS